MGDFDVISKIKGEFLRNDYTLLFEVLSNKLDSKFSINHYKKLMSSSMLILKFHYVLLHLEHGQDYSL